MYFIHINVHMSIPISQFIPPPPAPLPLSPLSVHTFVLYICVSISALQTGSSVPTKSPLSCLCLFFLCLVSPSFLPCLCLLKSKARADCRLFHQAPRVTYKAEDTQAPRVTPVLSVYVLRKGINLYKSQFSNRKISDPKTYWQGCCNE